MKLPRLVRNQPSGSWWTYDKLETTLTQLSNRISILYDVYAPAGTKIRVGTVAPQLGWGSGGATQYELLQKLPNSAFKNQRPLP